MVTKNARHKKRLVVDFSQTVNSYTNLDAYPLPKINELVNNIAQYRVFSTVDLKSAYHQIPLREEDKKFTAFKANRRLYQFGRIPFGVTNGVAAFQRTIDNFIAEENLQDTFAYIDDVTICGRDQDEHDRNLKLFLEAAERKNLTLNDNKSTFSSRSIHLLGYVVSEGEIKPDPERLKPLKQLPPPTDRKSQKRVIGLFAYYSQWIQNFSDKIRVLVQNDKFPLEQNELSTFNALKADIEKSVMSAVDENAPFEVETDASEFALAGTLNQNGRPVAFFSRTLTKAELNHSAVEKEAAAIIESVRKWRHYLTGKHFKLVTDQQSVAYMFEAKHKSKIKNDKIQRWRIELSTYNFDIVYRCGAENVPADTLSRIRCMSLTVNKLYELHNALCHPGISRMMHFVRARNLPFSVEDVKKMTNNCKICAEVKPRYTRWAQTPLIKATQPFERLSIDFKGPLPSHNQNKYLLVACDEFSRFPFAFACRDTSSRTVIHHLCTLFSIFGMPTYIHSDRGVSFMSSDLKTFLHSKGIATSRTTAYNPAGNGQVERLNGTIWKSITLALKSNNLPEAYWQEVLDDALHSIRSLLCTATNCTHHERMFSFARRSTNGLAVPSWLLTPGIVLLKRHARSSKYDPYVDEVDLIEANPLYAHVKFRNGREDTVALKHLAPAGSLVPSG